MSKARTVVHGAFFDQLAHQMVPDVERLDDILDGVTWSISTRPEWYVQIPGTTLRMAKTDPFPGAPAMRIYFTIDNEDTCTLQWIEYAEPPGTDDEPL